MSETPEQAEVLRRRRTSQLVGASLVVALIFGIALLVLQLTSGGSPPNPDVSPTQSPTTNPEPLETVMIRVVDESDDKARVAGNMLTGIGTESVVDAVVLPMPDNLVVASNDVSPRPLRRPGAGPRGSVDTVAVTLGVRVDASWNLERKALAGLVDGVGGVLIDVPKRTVVRSNDGDVVDRFAKGRQRMSGTPASWYAVGQVRGQTAQDAMRRFESVMLASLSELPQRETDIRQTLTALGALSPSTVPSEDLSGYLLKLSGEIADANYQAVSLPVTEVGEFAWTDYPQATPLLAKVMPDNLWTVTEVSPPRALVTAQARPPGLIASTRDALIAVDFEWVDGRAVDVTKSEPSRILVNGLPEWGFTVAEALGLPRDTVKLNVKNAKSEALADVEVILGSEYRAN